VYVFTHWPEVLQQEVSMLESTYCRGTFMTVTTAPNVMLLMHLSQKSDHHKTTHNGIHLFHYPEHPQHNQQSNITSRQYAPHPEKSVAVFIP